MHIEDKKNLPEHIRQTIPDYGQELYIRRFNSAYREYNNAILAHKLAWTQIEKIYPKDYRRKSYEM